MNTFVPILTRELKAYLRTPLGLVYTVVFLILSNAFVFYLGDIFEIGQATLQPFFKILPWVFLLMVPALSMRSWAEEIRSGTIELLDSLPIPTWQLVLAKFAGLWTVAAIALMLSFPLWLTISWLGQPDQGSILLGYLGSMMLLAAMLSIGLCLSSLSENQLIVYMITALVILLYLLAGYPLALNPIRDVFPQALVDLIASYSLLEHQQAIIRGVLDLRDVLFFLATCAFWLSLNVFILSARKGGSNYFAGLSRGLLVVIAMFLIYLSAVFLVIKVPSVRLDLTENKLFTLSEGSKRILADAKDPVSLTLYYSEKEARPYPQFRQYAERVIEKIEEYSAQSGGKIRFNLIDPIPFSNAEDKAILKGILPVPLEDGSGPLYFGLTAETDKASQAIGFVKPESEQYLEYELSKLIQTLQRNKKPRVTLVSELSVSGNNNPERGPLTQAWVIYRLLSERYQVEQLSPVNLVIPADTDVLWVIHPRRWPQETLAQIKRYVESGRKAIIQVDPNAESVPVLAVSETSLNNLYLGSELEPLFSAWGIGFKPDQVVLDSKFAWLMQLDENQFPKRNPALLSLPSKAMNQNDPATAALDRIVLSSAGALTLKEESPLTIEPLLQSSDSSRLINVEEFRKSSEDPESLLNGFVSTQEPFVLAARFKGLLGKSGKNVDFIVVADSDVASDRLWVVENSLFGQPVFNAQASNGDFFFNMIDQLSGSDNLISIRSRGKVSRPFEKVDQIRRNAELEYRNRQVELLSELEKTQSGINAYLQDRVGIDVAKDPAYKILADRKIALRQDLRSIQRKLNEDVENLGRTVKIINIFGIPILLMILGIIVSIRRRFFTEPGRIRHGTL
jgi:ABC-type uncharacterized transport system involved in gliding motility auxiliary subunit/ABC-type transport system involved in multi-copper enzyme maturation permease subunit